MRRLAALCIIVLVIILLVVRCGSHDKSTELATQQEYIVKLAPAVKPLYFDGTIAPFATTNVATPVEGIVTTRNFTYGEEVQQNQVLFVVSSPKTQEDFQTAVSGYMKANADYKDKERQYVAAVNLQKQQFISQDDFFSKKNARDDSYMTMLQARYKLIGILQELGLDTDLSHYQRIDRDKIMRSMLNKWDKVEINAPISGVALEPIVSGNDDKPAAVQKGDTIKQGQIVVSIGDLTGVSVSVNVSEVDLSRMSEGLKAIITGPAFPGIELVGKVVTIDKQAKPSQGGLATFPVYIKVASLTKEQYAAVHVGMSAKVEIDLTSENQMTVPIAAIIEKDGKFYVNVKDTKTEKTHLNEVVTGDTSLDSVVIIKGLKAGDTIVYSRQDG